MPYNDIFEAIDARDEDGVRDFLRNPGVDLNFTKNGMSPLHNAIISCSTEIALDLIKAGADVNVISQCGDTPLHYAALRGSKEVALALINEGAIVDVISIGGAPLHYAALAGHKEVVLTLIEHGADVHSRNKFDDTPLHSAAMGGRAEIALDLIKAGADMEAINKYHQTPLDLAYISGHIELALAMSEVSPLYHQHYVDDESSEGEQSSEASEVADENILKPIIGDVFDLGCVIS